MTADAAPLALLLCGLQRDFVSRGGALDASGFDLDGVHAALPTLVHLLALARACEVPVVHLPEQTLAAGASESRAWRTQRRINGWPDDLVAQGTPGEEFVNGFEPLPGELVAPRHRSGGLGDTRAPVLLRSGGVRRVVIAGVEAHRAVLGTVVQAVCLDFEVVVVREAVGGTAPTLTASTLDVLRSWARIVSLDEFERELELVATGPKVAAERSN